LVSVAAIAGEETRRLLGEIDRRIAELPSIGSGGRSSRHFCLASRNPKGSAGRKDAEASPL
jgi:hypothetical protein